MSGNNRLYFRLIPTQLKQAQLSNSMPDAGRKQSVAAMTFEITDLDFTAWQKVRNIAFFR